MEDSRPKTEGRSRDTNRFRNMPRWQKVGLVVAMNPAWKHADPHNAMERASRDEFAPVIVVTE
jgi:hypothetical protein